MVELTAWLGLASPVLQPIRTPLFIPGASRSAAEIVSNEKPRDTQKNRRIWTSFDAGGPR
jgi:hypothetical protein